MALACARCEVTQPDRVCGGADNLAPRLLLRQCVQQVDVVFLHVGETRDVRAFGRLNHHEFVGAMRAGPIAERREYQGQIQALRELVEGRAAGQPRPHRHVDPHAC